MKEDLSTGHEPVSATALRNGRTTRCMKRQLRKLTDQLAEKYPNDPPLLLQYGGPGTEWQVDRHVGWRRARGLFIARNDNPLDTVLDLLVEIRDASAENREQILAVLDKIRGDTSATRDMVAAA